MTKFTKFAVAAAFAFGFVSIASAATVTVPPNLMQGSMGQEVMDMQGILGITADGNFGPMTKASVMAFQSANGLTADGVVGPMTAAKLNAVATPVVPTPDTEDEEDTDTNDNTLSGGETSIESFDLNDGDDSTVMEGEEEVEIAEIEFDVEDADAELDRADFVFDGSAATEDKPWNVFDRVAIMDGDEVIAEMDTDSKSDWDETDTNDIYRVRLSGIGYVFNEGDNATLSVVVDVANSVDDAGTTADWTFYVTTDTTPTCEDDGLRFVDSEGINSYAGECSSGVDFSVDEIGADDELDVKTSSSDPDATQIAVDETSTTEEMVFAFKLETGNDSGDIQINEFDLEIEATDPDNGEGEALDTLSIDDNIVDEVTIEVDGDTFTADLVTDSADLDNSTGTATYNFEFDEGDFIVDGDDDVTVEVTVKFKKQDNNYDNGTGITLSIDESTVDATGVDSEEDVTMGASVISSEDHTLSTSVAAISSIDWEIGAAGTIIDFLFTAEAQEDDIDVLIADITAVDTTAGTATIGTPTVTKISGDASGVVDNYTIADGDTARFRVRYAISGTNGQFANVTIPSILGVTISDEDQVSPTATLNVN